MEYLADHPDLFVIFIWHLHYPHGRHRIGARLFKNRAWTGFPDLYQHHLPGRYDLTDDALEFAQSRT